jgi:hypothetical protein
MRVTGKRRGEALTAEGQFSRNLAAQESSAWVEYLQRGTEHALKAWRNVRLQLRRERGIA